MPADYPGDVAGRHAFVGDRVQRRFRRHIFYRLTAEAGIAVFKIAFMQWIYQADPAGLPQVIRDSLDELRVVTADK